MIQILSYYVSQIRFVVSHYVHTLNNYAPLTSPYDSLKRLIFWALCVCVCLEEEEPYCACVAMSGRFCSDEEGGALLIEIGQLLL